MSRLFLGNIPWGFTEDDVREWIEAEGFEVAFVDLILNRATGQPRGIGFATLVDDSQTRHAVESLNHRKIGGRVIIVCHAFPVEIGRRRATA